MSKHSDNPQPASRKTDRDVFYLGFTEDLYSEYYTHFKKRPHTLINNAHLTQACA